MLAPERPKADDADSNRWVIEHERGIVPSTEHPVDVQQHQSAAPTGTALAYLEEGVEGGQGWRHAEAGECPREIAGRWTLG